VVTSRTPGSRVRRGRRGASGPAGRLGAAPEINRRHHTLEAAIKTAWGIGAALAVALLPVLARGGDVELLPEVTAQAKGAYYAPAEDAFVWDTWVGAGAGLLRVETATVYLTGDVETILGRERRAFDANQANYHVETGLRIRAGRQILVPFLHHVSRHEIDRPKSQLVDWNLLGVEIVGPLPGRLGFPGRYAVSVGRTVKWRTVGYGWELRGVVDVEPLRRAWGAAYVRADVRFVTVQEDASFPRGDFADFLGEGGLRFLRGGRNLNLFVAYEHRNDVLLLEAGARDRALFGLRIGFAAGGDAPPNLPLSFPGPPP
jgi:hypothetical protein